MRRGHLSEWVHHRGDQRERARHSVSVLLHLGFGRAPDWRDDPTGQGSWGFRTGSLGPATVSHLMTCVISTVRCTVADASLRMKPSSRRGASLLRECPPTNRETARRDTAQWGRGSLPRCRRIWECRVLFTRKLYSTPRHACIGYSPELSAPVMTPGALAAVVPRRRLDPSCEGADDPGQ